ncbi:hypothetical protein [Peribacillus alkalitolerans]|uniref:hypothetical protein n=1 Tax=Peribacillus alkalitolerans TaxID=1550385 RepID=UPI0013D37B45|nr:hypothetical protein [Peribacillus alkalitolerans]
MSNQTETKNYSHKQLATACFNKVWDFLDKKNRNDEENEQMIHMCHSSFWHWTQVEDHTKTNLSIGYWQLSRVYAVVGQGENSLRYAKKCIAVSDEAELPPFYRGYAYEAEARAHGVLGNHPQKQIALEHALELLDQVTVAENKKLLQQDLDELKG